MTQTRYNKKTMSVGGADYQDLLKLEIASWSQYSSGTGHKASLADLNTTAAYQTYRKGTVELELSYIKALSKDKVKVLELGSADGWLSNEILNLGNVDSVTSIDVSITDKLQSKYDGKLKVVQGDLNMVEQINFPEKFDVIITHGTLHHLVNPAKTLDYAISNLLNPSGILIINDTWKLQSLQLKTNSFFYTFLNRLPHAIIKKDLKETVQILSKKIPKILFSKKYAESLAHNHIFSPFESISSADDYQEIYKRSDLNLIFFKTYASLPGLQNAWSGSPMWFKNTIQKIDNFLLKTKLFCGDVHISILKKI